MKAEMDASLEAQAKVWYDEVVDQYMQAFETTDVDNNGEVTYEELVAALQAMETGGAQTGLAQVHQKIRKNGLKMRK